MEPLEFLNKHCEFITDYDCYVLMAVSRKKDTPSITNSQEIVFREVIKNKEDIPRKYYKIKSQTINYEGENEQSFPFYIYVSLNRRDAKKATFSLMKRVLGWLEEESNGVNRSKMLKKLYGYFYSELTRPESRSSGQKYFMVDFDEKDSVNMFLNILKDNKIEPILIQETRNGYHIKIEPFDRRRFDEWNMGEKGKNKFDAEIKTDALMFVEYVHNQGGDYN